MGSLDEIAIFNRAFSQEEIQQVAQSGLIVNEPLCLCPADINGDNVVDNADIGAFINAFLAADPAGDFNLDGVIDNADIGAFVTAFLNEC